VEKGYLGPFSDYLHDDQSYLWAGILAWQERKAASFRVLPPLYCGYHVGWDGRNGGNAHLSFNGFVPTELYAVPNGGINIATAVAISGAAGQSQHGISQQSFDCFPSYDVQCTAGLVVVQTREDRNSRGRPVGSGSELPEWPSPRFAPL